MPSTRQIAIARLFGALHRLYGGNIYGRKIENLYYEWVGQNVPHCDHEALHTYFNSQEQTTEESANKSTNREGQPLMHINANQDRAARLLGEAARLIDAEHPHAGAGDSVRRTFDYWTAHGGIQFDDVQRAELALAFAKGDSEASKIAKLRTRPVLTTELRPDMVLSDGRHVSSVIRNLSTTTNAWGKNDKITYDIIFALGRPAEKVEPNHRWDVQY